MHSTLGRQARPGVQPSHCWKWHEIKGDVAIAAAKALASAVKDKLEGSAFKTVAQSARRALAVARRD
ncbi:hypothetical protein XA68_11317 [Ophiocordyceps unilateralis]|uniref:Uncharacterized protein n=1 Tax=Ophiocordyceps unilateralis TaxID=268505 RepID=A0A2A9NXB8_OPHUN|nr:hypothetical protein XA68_11317 [Ophiocordyceps unilateralis]